MSSVRELHDKAMRLAQEAMAARHKGDIDRAILLARDALLLEQQAADLVPEDPKSEPTRSILYKSAASLALQCKELKEAQRLVGKGLAGYPPPDVEEQLKDIYAQVNYEKHLLVRGVTLTDEDLQVAIDGKAVGHGMILFNEYMKRIKSTGTMIDRTSDRLMNKEFQAKGRRAKMFRPPTKSITTGRDGSFAVTIRISYAQGEQMSVLVTPELIIDELITGIELINNGREEALKERIGNPDYYVNFVSLAREIAPDGDNVNFVGFTSTKRAVALTIPNEEIVIDTSALQFVSQIDPIYRTPIEIEGILDIAIGRGEEKLGLITEDGSAYEIVASEGYVDIVRQYFKQTVKVKGEYDKQYVYLISLSPVEE